MGEAQKVIIKPISTRAAAACIRRLHYSGKVVNNSQLGFGAFFNGRLEGAMQFGPPLDKRKMLGLVRGTEWSQMLELNRMAFSENLPRNSESRALGYVFRVIKKNYPQIKWVVSFADATQCGDGTIYRASGFFLTGIKRSLNLAQFPNGEIIHKMTFESNTTTPRNILNGMSYYDVTGGRYNWNVFCEKVGAVQLPGFQIRYIKFLDSKCQENLTVPIIPFKKIKEIGASMYRGNKGAESVESPTSALHIQKRMK
tara:strand:- start:181 stop:945 length:765 start_codon:yes stop_codon:yes gene_type:complete